MGRIWLLLHVAEEPKTRPKIEIQPRSIPIDANRAPAALPSSIFGEAKPVDTTKREMEIEAKLQTMSTTVRSRGATPPPRLTPMSNRSRSSSVSSLSSARSVYSAPKLIADCIYNLENEKKKRNPFFR